MTPEEIVERAAEVLDGHWNWSFPSGMPTCMGCGATLNIHGWTPGMDVHPAIHRHQVALLAAAGLLPTEVEWSAEGEETDGHGDVRHFRDVHPDRDGAELAARAMDQLENVRVWPARRYVTPWTEVSS